MIQGFIRVDEELIKTLSNVKDLEEKMELLDSSEESMDIGKSWQFLLYLLTGDKYGGHHFISNLFYPKKSTVLITDEEFEKYSGNISIEEFNKIQNKIDLNASYLNPEEVKIIMSHLNKVSIESLFDKCDFNEVKEKKIYPGGWDMSFETKKYVADNFNRLVLFLNRSIKGGNFVISECV